MIILVKTSGQYSQSAVIRPEKLPYLSFNYWEQKYKKTLIMARFCFKISIDATMNRQNKRDTGVF